MGHNDSVEAFYGRFSDAWKANDGAALADFFTDDGTLINPFGERADGREAVAAMYGGYFTGMLQGTTTAVQGQSVRPIDGSHAFADAEQTIYSPGGDVLLAVHLAALLRRDDNGWRFVDARPYTTTPPPG